jgi:hypothetical protein
MKLPPHFQFSQSSLQDFVDCPRRFYYRYVLDLQYPAPQSAPLREFELHMQQGEQFHRLAHQAILNIAPELLEATIDDDRVYDWWERFLAGGLVGLPERRFPEITMSVPLAGYRLVAKYDCIAIGERVLIVDWKTSLRRPVRETLANRMQTIVYPYVLAKAGEHLYSKQRIAPETISMMYWFTEFPDEPIIFDYSAAKFAQDGAYLERLAHDLLSRDGQDAFPLTDDLNKCKFCTYRSLDRRGTKAGDFREQVDDESENGASPFNVDLDQIAEIEF